MSIINERDISITYKVRTDKDVAVPTTSLVKMAFNMKEMDLSN